MTDELYQGNFLGQYDGMAPVPEEKPTLGEFAEAKWEQSFPMAAYRLWNTPDFENEVGFEPMKDPRFSETGRLKQVRHKFGGARSKAELEYQIDRYDQEIANLRIIGDSSKTYGAGLAMDFGLDPITYVPVLGVWSKGARAIDRAAGAAAVSTAFTVPYEAVRRADSMTRTNTESAMTVGSMFVLSGALGAAFGRKGTGYLPDSTPVGLLPEPKPKSLGAAAPVDPDDLARQESLRPTRTGIESLPLTPIVRLLNSGDPYVVGVATDLTETSGMILNKIDDQIPMTNDSVTVRFRTEYLPRLFDAIQKADDAFLRFKGVAPNSAGLTSNAIKLGTQRLAELGGKNNVRLDFNQRVGLALMRGEDTYADSMTPFVNEAAGSYKGLLDFIGDQGMSVKLFEKEIDKYIERLGTGADNAGRVEKLQLKKQALAMGGVQATRTSAGYFPRIYDVAYLLTSEGESAWMRALTPEIGQDAARGAWQRITNSYDDTFEGFNGLLDDIANSGAQSRMLDVDDEILVPFLDFNVESVIRDYTRRMGMDIELTRKFGSVGMEDVIDGIKDQAARRDISALRDVIRGTYGRPSDPHSAVNRGVTLLKNFSPLVYMGGAMVSSLPDMARPIMTEGINAVYGGGLKAMLSSQREVIMQMNRKMVREVGEALDMTLSMRAFAMADIGSAFGRQSHIEKTIKDLQAPYFLLNGLNVWNTAMKEFTGLVVSQRMLTAMNRDWQKISKADKERLLANGIDGPMAGRIAAMMKVEGFAHQIDGFWFPELAKWTDTGAADAFKRALNQQINRTIVTPDVGDRALWTQTHVGSMIAQFKSFGQASTQRVLISGLQERNANFWHGAIAMTGLGLVVNEIKDIQYGITRERTWGQTLSDAIDRAGLLAVFSDVNHALETISSNRMGLDALAGGDPYPTSTRRMISEFGGPSGGVLFDFGNMASEAFQGRAFSDSFMGSFRRTTPYQSHPLFPSFLYQ